MSDTDYILARELGLGHFRAWLETYIEEAESHEDAVLLLVGIAHKRGIDVPREFTRDEILDLLVSEQRKYHDLTRDLDELPETDEKDDR